MEQDKKSRLNNLRKSLASRIKASFGSKLESNYLFSRDIEILRNNSALNNNYHTNIIANDVYFNPEVSKNKNRTMKGNIHYGFPDENILGYTKPKTFFN